MAAHACPVAEWLAGPVPVLASLSNARVISSLAQFCRVDCQPRTSYTPKKDAVCLNFGRQVVALREQKYFGRAAIGIGVSE